MNVGQRVQKRLRIDRMKKKEKERIVVGDLVKFILALPEDEIYRLVKSREDLFLDEDVADIISRNIKSVNVFLRKHSLWIEHLPFDSFELLKPSMPEGKRYRNRVPIIIIETIGDYEAVEDKPRKRKSFWRFWK